MKKGPKPREVTCQITEQGCHEITSHKVNKLGYLLLKVNGDVVYAHRRAWEQANGPIPEGMFICHHCDNPKCINPAHLFLGTCADNIKDRDAKGRQAKGEKVANSKLTESQVREMRSLHAQGLHYKDIAKQLGVTPINVWHVLHDSWRHVAP